MIRPKKDMRCTSQFMVLLPDIAGKEMANPIAELLSFSMSLRYSFDMPEDADLIEKSIQVLAEGIRTPDIMQEGMTLVSTSVMMDNIVSKLDRSV